jgi:hypothetical protein
MTAQVAILLGIIAVLAVASVVAVVDVNLKN